jgi:hypothetical protein
MRLIGRFKKFPLPQALVLQYSLNQWKIAGVQSDPLYHATSRPDCFTIPTYLLYGALSFVEANRFSASQEIPRILWTPNVHYRIHKGPLPVPTLKHIDPVHAAPPHFLKIHRNVNIYIRQSNRTLKDVNI